MRLCRIVISVLFLAGTTLLFTVSGAWAAIHLGWIARLQLMPLILSGGISALAVWFLTTLLLGRIYCSTVCPLGALQDIFARIPRWGKKRRRRHPYRYSPPNNRLRYPLLLIVGLCGAAGLAVVVTLFDPYSAFGRIAANLLRPLADMSAGAKIISGSAIGIVIALATLLATAFFSWRKGRLICNTVCPVGGALSVVSRWALFHFDIDTDVCVNCRACEHACKSRCISMADHTVDSSRCVVCFDCVDACSEGAIRYTTRRKRLSIPMLRKVETGLGAAASPMSAPVKVDRRKFLATGLLVAAAPLLDAAEGAADAAWGASSGQSRMRPVHPVAPPGRRSMADFLEKCTGCGLCVAHCPTAALTPSVNQYGWHNFLHPVMDYDRGGCRFDCTRCTELCPTGALTPLTKDEKHIFIIGHARVQAANCVGCRLCAERCPRGAIAMEWRGGGNPYLAVVNTADCIGCGICQNVCPATPFKAIIVNGII